MKSVMSRRSFLHSAGVGAGLVPLLSGERASAAAAPKRLVVMFMPNGIIHEKFWPVGSGTSLATMTLPDTVQPLAPFRDKLLFVGGLELTSYKRFYEPTIQYFDGHHSVPHLLTGKIGVRGVNSSRGPDGTGSDYQPAGGGISLDQWYADEVGKTTKLRFPIITAGVQHDSGPTLTQLSFRGPDTPNAIENSPLNMYKRLFANLSLDAGGLEKLRKRRKSILDFVAGRVERFAKTVSAEDKQQVQQHLDAVRRLEMQLDALPGASCSSPTMPGTVDIRQNDQVPLLIRSQIDNIVTALSCDLSRSVTLGLSGGGGGWFPSWLKNPDFEGAPLAGNAGNARSHHDLAHASANNPEAIRLKAILEKWFMEQLAYLLSELDKRKEGSGSMLDNSIVMLVNNMGQGNHQIEHVPFLVAGGAGLKMGQSLSFGEWAGKRLKGKCVPHNGLLVAVANALTGQNLPYFGDPQFGGELPGLRP